MRRGQAFGRKVEAAFFWDLHIRRLIQKKFIGRAVGFFHFPKAGNPRRKMLDMYKAVWKTSETAERIGNE